MCRVFAVVVTILAFAGCSSSANPPAEEDAVEVARVGDGDSIELESGERVRLVQIDAPELGEDECYGEEALAALEKLLQPGSSVRLEADSRLDDTDRFDRLLRYVRLGDLNVNLELVRRGAASVWFVDGPGGTQTSSWTPPGKHRRPGAASGALAPAPGSIRSAESTPSNLTRSFFYSRLPIWQSPSCRSRTASAPRSRRFGGSCWSGCASPHQPPS
jgi:endonuclease YncB( thermonuclease family)